MDLKCSLETGPSPLSPLQTGCSRYFCPPGWILVALPDTLLGRNSFFLGKPHSQTLSYWWPEDTRSLVALPNIWLVAVAPNPREIVAIPDSMVNLASFPLSKPGCHRRIQWSAVCSLLPLSHFISGFRMSYLTRKRAALGLQTPLPKLGDQRPFLMCFRHPLPLNRLVSRGNDMSSPHPRTSTIYPELRRLVQPGNGSAHSRSHPESTPLLSLL